MAFAQKEEIKIYPTSWSNSKGGDERVVKD